MDFKQQLERQLRFLETSCREYDAGHRDEAIRMAVQMRVVFHNTKNSISLLAHLKSRFINILSTSNKRPSNNPNGYWPGLVQFVLSPQESIFECKPKFDATKAANRFVPLNYWWNSEPIYQSGHMKIRRKDLVLAAANTDGGAHVDSSLPPNYQWIVDGTGWKVNFKPDNGPEREVILHYAHLAALRQIAYEVLLSPELLKLAGR